MVKRVLSTKQALEDVNRQPFTPHATDNKIRNQELALVNLRRENASLRKALQASDRALQAYKAAVLAWYENTEGETDVPEERDLITLEMQLKGEK
jgi:hypothetical protein